VQITLGIFNKCDYNNIATHLGWVFKGGNVMENDYKHEIMELIETIENTDFIIFLYNLIKSLKKKWGV
jgi:hypothetical protein